MRPWILAETNHAYTKDNPYEVAVLPLGATEPHNLHLPYAQDVFESNIIGEHICEAAHNQGAKVVALMAPLQNSPRCIMVHEESGIESFEDLKNIILDAEQVSLYFDILDFFKNKI